MSDDLEFLLWQQAVGGATEVERAGAVERLARRQASRRRSRDVEADLEKVRAIVEAQQGGLNVPAGGRQDVHRQARAPRRVIRTRGG